MWVRLSAPVLMSVKKPLQTAIKEKGLTTHQQVGQCLKAGTNCGSCIPEIKALFGVQT